jgi:hypothetical protein
VSPSSLDPQADPSHDSARDPVPGSGRGSAQQGAPRRRSPTAPSSTEESQVADAAPASEQRSRGRSGHSRAAVSEAVPKLVLDLKAVADVAGLEQEVAVLRASIRQLANNGDMATHVKVLAELRHQIEALCRALKTQQALEGHDGDERAAEMARVLEELGDELGVSR